MDGDFRMIQPIFRSSWPNWMKATISSQAGGNSGRTPRLQRNLPSSLANRLISAVSGIYLHDYGCTLKAYRRQALQRRSTLRRDASFHSDLRILNGARVTEIPVRHHARRHGISNYSLIRIPKVLFDLLVVVFLHRFAQRPIRFWRGRFNQLWRA